MDSNRVSGSSGDERCRICQEGRNESKDGSFDLLAPCACSGSIKWIHRSCLERWRLEKRDTEHYSVCELCKTPYAVSRRTPTILDYIRLKVPLKERIFYVIESFYLIVRIFGFAEKQMKRFSRNNISSLQDENSSSLVLFSPHGPVNILSVVIWCVWWLCKHWVFTGSQGSYDITIFVFHISSTVRHILQFLQWRRESGLEVLINRSDLQIHG